ncbi:glycosyltransferase [Loktanella sp. F6476L]|uniref:glycosyltransferase family 2 protein n=1 Tax=Loktanella sp. F6476L TaxID=2926405 RepID=UPI001FF29909|nr:glycosyltransferase family 2 protein [Loktanella sp. F6476L]MCK0122603.1 glycosyltransferase [Loktanella sp. F6476L]
MTSQKITAIVPTYNRAAFLSEALAAIFNQTCQVDEVIVWDDGSTDETESVVRAANGPIRYFRAENGGKSRALNAAMAKATGDLIWICDDDDIALPHAVEILVGLLVKYPDAGASGGGYRRFHTDPTSGDRIEQGPGYWPDLSQGSVLRHLLEDIFLFQNATLVRRTAYHAVGAFKEDLPRSIDYDMIVRLALHKPVVVTDTPLFLQRKHDGERGPAAARHSAARSDEVWEAADRAVFKPFYDSIPLSRYATMYGGSPQASHRAALLQRACIYARRTDWGLACADFKVAANIAPDCPLSTVETAICRRAMAGKHGIYRATTPEIRATLSDLAQSNISGTAIARALRRGLRWRLRDAIRAKNLGEAMKITQLAIALSRGHNKPTETPMMSAIERTDPYDVANEKGVQLDATATS